MTKELVGKLPFKFVSDVSHRPHSKSRSALCPASAVGGRSTVLLVAYRHDQCWQSHTLGLRVVSCDRKLGALSTLPPTRRALRLGHPIKTD